MKTRSLSDVRLLAAASVALAACAVAPRPARAFDWQANTRAQEQFTALVQGAYAAHESGNGTAALALLDQADKLRANVADSANLRGAIHLRQGAYDKAEAAFNRAVACDPKLWAARFNLAEVPFRQKDYAKARARFDFLVTQTNRFKEQMQWELAQYKAVLCSVLLRDDAGAQKRLARLPEGAQAVTPARLCAQAAMALARKDNAAATRFLADTQQGKYAPATTALFVNALELSGWLPATSSLNAAAALAAAGAGNPSASPVASSLAPGRGLGATLPFNLPITGSEPELPVADGSAPPPSPPRVTNPAPPPSPVPTAKTNREEEKTEPIQPDP